MGAVKEQKPKKMSLLSRKLFSLLLLVALAVSATASPAEERGFFRLQCYTTCQAASFASTTSCTFGGFFWSTTLTCAQIFPSSQPTLLVGLSNQPKLLLLLLRNLRRGVSSGCSATPPARLPALLQPPATPLEDSSGEPH